jgi:type VII secretion-associated protein (TIGR03931 family)
VIEVVVDVGPGAIRGPNSVRQELVSAALDAIEDDIALVDERPAAVHDLWHDVMRAAVGSGVETVVVVCPTWWPPSWIERVRVAAGSVATSVVVLPRTRLLREGITNRQATIVEIAPEFVVVTRSSGASFVPRADGPAAIADAVVAAVGISTAAHVDAPAGVDDVERLSAVIADRLRVNGVAVTFTDEDSVRRAAASTRVGHGGSERDAGVRPRLRGHRRRSAVAAGMVMAVLLCGGFAARGGGEAVSDELPTTLLVEGRVAVMVPAAWRVQRITSGPGSARVQIVSPSDTGVALHVTQSVDASQGNLAVTADSLRTALNEEPDGVFVDFDASGTRAGRAAITYREIRDQHHVAWAVVIDAAVRIAIGCQSAPGREHVVRDVCDRAIQSAHLLP